MDRKKTYNSPAANILRASRESPLKYLSYQDLENRMTVRTAQTAKTSHRGSERPAWGRHRVQNDFLSEGSKGDRLYQSSHLGNTGDFERGRDQNDPCQSL